MRLRFLVIDGYTRAARDQLQSGGASLAADLYRAMLERCSPAGSACDILFPSDPGADLPTGNDLQAYDGIAWTGCSLGCNDGSHEVESQIALQQRAFQAGLPGFGSCWAAQIAVAAAGGKVQPNPHGREMGIARKIALTPEGRAHPLHEGRPVVFDAFTSHDDEITHLPPGAVALSGNAFTRVQSVCVRSQGGAFWGLQYHPEYDLHEMARLIFCRIEKLVRLGIFRSEGQANAYIEDLESLHADPTRSDLAWKLGLDSDVMDAQERETEVRNWILRLVLPSRAARTIEG
ncbi:MAG TPA: hypothetical protein VMN36_09425 [Verrucomicrobiales bacterium]|nr:hypothetical protein [Verrucomicrobiales bacterium]